MAVHVCTWAVPGLFYLLLGVRHPQSSQLRPLGIPSGAPSELIGLQPPISIQPPNIELPHGNRLRT